MELYDPTKQRSPVVSQLALDFLKQKEGYSPTASWDYKQYSGGYGTRGQPGQTYTPESAEADLRGEAGKVNDFINANAKTQLSDPRRAALTSFGYNLGTGEGGLADIMPYVNAGDFAGAAAKMQRYNHAGGKVLSGLTERRGQEAAMLGGDVSPAQASVAQALAGGPQAGAGGQDALTGGAGADTLSGMPTPPSASRAALAKALLQRSAEAKPANAGELFSGLVDQYMGQSMAKEAEGETNAYNSALADKMSLSPVVRALMASGDPALKAAAIQATLAPKPQAQIVTLKDPRTGQDVSAAMNPDGTIRVLDPENLQGNIASPNSPSFQGANGPINPNQVGINGGGQGGAPGMFQPQGVSAPGQMLTIPQAPPGANPVEWRKQQTDKVAKEQADMRDRAISSSSYLNDARDIRRQVQGYDPKVFTPAYANETGRAAGSWIPNIGLTDMDKRIQQRNQLEANVGRLAAGYAKATLGPRLTDADMARAEQTFGMGRSTDQNTALQLLDQRAREAHQNVAHGIQNGLINPAELDPATVEEGLRMGVYKPEWFGGMTKGQVAGGKGDAAPRPTASRSAPAIGTVEAGHVFKGGDPANPASWSEVLQ